MLAWKPDHKLATNCTPATLETWARDIDLLNRIDGVDYERIAAVLAWLPESVFWAQNIQSGAKLRRHFDRLEDESKRARGRMRVVLDPGLRDGYAALGLPAAGELPVVGEK